LLVAFVAFQPVTSALSVTEAPVSALGVMAPNTPPDLAGIVTVEHNVTVDGVVRTYRSISPTTLTGKLPLLVVLHGRGEGPWTAVRTTGFLPLAREGKAVVIYPEGVERSWNAGGGCCGTAGQRGLPDTAFVDAAVSDAITLFPVDATRVYLAGYSNGGKLAYTVACSGGTRYAGVATYGSVPLSTCPAGPRMPFLIAAGARDTILPINGSPKAHPALLPVRTVAAGLAARDGCSGPTAAAASGGATVQRWTRCTSGDPVELVVYPNADHAWPTSMATIMWGFLSGSGAASTTTTVVAADR
jgi:polyhydroxybutyrate depolymerase